MRALGIAAITMVVMAPVRPARADAAYFGLGFGGATLGGDIDRVFETDGEIGGRVVGGLRWGDTALEASFFGTDLHLADGSAAGSHSTLSLGIGVKQYVTLGEHVAIYVRGGLDYTWLIGALGRPAFPPVGYHGRGYDLGTGLQLDRRWRLSGRASAAGVSLWLDAGIQRMRLHSSSGKPMTGGLSAANLGVAFELSW